MYNDINNDERMTMTTTTKTTTTTTTRTETFVGLPDTAIGLIAKFNEAKAAIKLFEAEKAEAEAALREMLQGAEVGVIDGVERLRISVRNNSKIDRELLKTAWPEAFEATLVVTPYTVLQTK
jgi:predicted phage-related endonuclease